MSIIDKLSWYSQYNLILEKRTVAEKKIEDLENPEKQLQRVKKFYTNLGADYSKNNWIIQAEQEMSEANEGEDNNLVHLRSTVKFAKILENAIIKQDDESIGALNTYKDGFHEMLYANFIRQVMFYIGVSKVKKEPDFIQKAYDGIYKKYPLEKVYDFVDEGSYYFIYYFQCLQLLIKRQQGRAGFDEISAQIKDRCYNAKLMLDRFSTDMYLADMIQLILEEIQAVEDMLKEDKEG